MTFPFYFILIGCVIAELFTEGVPLFDLSQLLAYRKGHFQTEQVLMKIEDRSIRELVAFLFIWDFRYFVLFHVRFYKCLHSTMQKFGVGRLFFKFLKILWSLLCSLRLLFLDQKCSNIVIYYSTILKQNVFMWWQRAVFSSSRYFRNYSNMQILCPRKIIVLLLLFMLKPVVQLSIFLQIMIAYFFFKGFFNEYIVQKNRNRNPL